MLFVSPHVTTRHSSTYVFVDPHTGVYLTHACWHFSQEYDPLRSDGGKEKHVQVNCLINLN